MIKLMLKRSHPQNPEKQKGGGVIRAPTVAALDLQQQPRQHSFKTILDKPTPRLQLIIDFPARSHEFRHR